MGIDFFQKEGFIFHYRQIVQVPLNGAHQNCFYEVKIKAINSLYQSTLSVFYYIIDLYSFFLHLQDVNKNNYV